MIVETRPLHKKKKRLLLRQQSLLTQSTLDGPSDASGQNKQLNEVRIQTYHETIYVYQVKWVGYNSKLGNGESEN